MKKEKNFFGKKILKLIKSNIDNNKKEYIIISIILVLGILIGIIFVNNLQEAQIEEANKYLTSFIEKSKNVENIDYIQILKKELLNNLFLVGFIWLFSTTIVGIPIVFGIVIYKGFCLGYTIATIITSLGIQNGIGIVLSSLVLKNIIFIPVLLGLAVSGFKLYKSILKDKRRENIKFEMIRHTIISVTLMIILVISSIIDVFISNNIMLITVKYL